MDEIKKKQIYKMWHSGECTDLQDGCFRWERVILVILLLVIIAFGIWLAVVIFVTNSPKTILKKGCPEGSEIKDDKCYPPATTCPPASCPPPECTKNSECSDGKSCLTGSVCGKCTTASDCIDPVKRKLCVNQVCMA